ncbi:MAG: LytTR family DNA-binding domain-containing protein, partial [Oscillospiraceae bacterium]
SLNYPHESAKGEKILKIAVVDDSSADRECLSSYISRFAFEHNYEIDVSLHCLGENFLEDADFSSLDLVFLDIYMGEKTGMDVAKIMRSSGFSGKIVFCTTTAKYALEGYSVGATDYILKPYTYEKIEKLLTDIAKMLNEKVLSILIKDGRQWCKISVCDILYTENHANYVYIYTPSEMHSVRMSFLEMEATLAQYNGFIKCDRGIMVNLHNVREIHGNLISMNNGTIVTISRRNVAQVNEQYLSFIFREMEKS